MDKVHAMIKALRTKMGQHVGYKPGEQASGVVGDDQDYRNAVREAAAMGEPAPDRASWQKAR